MKTKLTNQKGFTIIEVLIVLAIAGLIMLVVFLAVPALQRNQRNGGRRTDGSRIAAAANDFVTNSNGKVPGATDVTADGTTIINNAGTLSNLGTLTSVVGGAAAGTCSGGGAMAAGKLTICTGATAAATPFTATTDAVTIATGAQCSGSNATVAGSSRQMAVLYTQETSSGNYTVACLNI